MIMHVTFDSLKTFYNILVQKLKNHRGNWNQNDPTADDYIKNRPFYSKNENVKVLSDISIDFSSGYEVNWGQLKTGYCYENVTNLTIKPGAQYTVNFDGIEYTLNAFIDKGFDNIIIGNGAFVSDFNSDNSIPFVLGNYNDDNWLYAITGDTGTHRFSVSATQEVVKKLDKKFIDMPDDIVTSEELNEVIDNIDNIDNQLNNLSHVAFSGNYYDLNNTPLIHEDVVRYSYQNLTDQQKSQVRTNIGAGENIVSYGYFSHYNIYTTTLSSTDYHDQAREIYLKKVELNEPYFNNLESCDVAKVNFLNKIWYCRASTIELSFADNSATAICFGNKSLYSITEEDTGEPFLLVPSYDAHRFNQKGIYFAKTEVDEVIEICANSDNSFIQLDEILIPDTIARVDDIQTYVDEAIENLDIPSGDSTVDLTGYATETYVNDAIANLVNSAPDALNTLDELAAALGDDENFATTVTNQIAGKLDASALPTAINDALAQAKASGEFNGAQGIQGETGAAGYTPVRGTDYWTEADKAEIKSYVDTNVSLHNSETNAHSDIRSLIGNLSNLNTTAKDNLVAAINEAAASGGSSTGGGSQVQADYAQNDSSAVDYIKNRPCYAEEDKVLFDQSITSAIMGDMPFNGYGHEPILFDPNTTKIGKTIVVTVDDVTYECELKTSSTLDMSAYGNKIIFLEGYSNALGYPIDQIVTLMPEFAEFNEDTGEPFLLVFEEGHVIIVTRQAGTYHYKVQADLYHMLDANFMPEVDALPAVTTDNNGQTLSVVNGEWAVTTAASGLPSVTTADNDKVLMVVDGQWVAGSIVNGDEVYY